MTMKMREYICNAERERGGGGGGVPVLCIGSW